MGYLFLYLERSISFSYLESRHYWTYGSYTASSLISLPHPLLLPGFIISNWGNDIDCEISPTVKKHVVVSIFTKPIPFLGHHREGENWDFGGSQDVVFGWWRVTSSICQLELYLRRYDNVMRSTCYQNPTSDVCSFLHDVF